MGRDLRNSLKCSGRIRNSATSSLKEEDKFQCFQLSAHCGVYSGLHALAAAISARKVLTVLTFAVKEASCSPDWAWRIKNQGSLDTRNPSATSISLFSVVLIFTKVTSWLFAAIVRNLGHNARHARHWGPKK